MPVDGQQSLRLQVWSPSGEGNFVPQQLGAQAKPTARHLQGLQEIQKFRDETFLRDHGFRWPRDYLDYDHQCWHVAFRDRAGSLVATMRTAVYPLAGFSGLWDLQISRYLRALPDVEAARFASSISERLAEAKKAGAAWLFEPGGWAIDPACRKSRVSALLPLSMWALGRFFGGCVGFAAATVPNGSSAVLRRLGAMPLVASEGELGPIHSDFHRCEMEILEFASGRLARDFERVVDGLTATLAATDILTPMDPRDSLEASEVAAG
jgi:hypothetical protein